MKLYSEYTKENGLKNKITEIESSRISIVIKQLKQFDINKMQLQTLKDISKFGSFGSIILIVVL